MARNYQQGLYEVENWDKYLGTKPPRYRSSYELKMFKWADRNRKVLKWSSEQVIVKYYNPIKQRMARYICDIYIMYVDKNGVTREALVEIKPLSQTIAPTRGKKRKDLYEKEHMTYIENLSKWTAAEKYAKDRGWDFRLITENSLFKG